VLRYIVTFFLLFAFPVISVSQIYVGFSTPDSTSIRVDSLNSTVINATFLPDGERNDDPFIDYKPAVIWNTPKDSLSDYACIRRNYTDQLVSVWKYPQRIYPASRIYAVDIDMKHFRAAKVAEQNYVFAEKVVDGNMVLYLYRKIPQLDGVIELTGNDTTGKLYRNNMIIENQVSKGKNESFGYFFSIGSDSLKPVSASTLKKFSDTYLNDTPHTKALADKFVVKKMDKSKKIVVAGLMVVGIVGLAATGGGAASWIFLAGFPAAAIVALSNRPHTLHWEDMIEIVKSYNKEISGTL
jgi:hypothetical protein